VDPKFKEGVNLAEEVKNQKMLPMQWFKLRGHMPPVPANAIMQLLY